MALYQYDLCLVRAERPERLLDALREGGLVQESASGKGVVLSGGARALVEEGGTTTRGGAALQVTALLVEDDDVPVLTRDFGALVAWLHDAARTADLLVAFMPGGPDASAGVPGVEPFLSALLDEGRVVSAHALMWLASSVAGGALCQIDNPAYRTVRTPGLGCLFAFVDVADDGSFEILEPGPLQSVLLDAWRRAPRDDARERH